MNRDAIIRVEGGIGSGFLIFTTATRPNFRKAYITIYHISRLGACLESWQRSGDPHGAARADISSEIQLIRFRRIRVMHCDPSQ